MAFSCVSWNSAFRRLEVSGIVLDPVLRRLDDVSGVFLGFRLLPHRQQAEVAGQALGLGRVQLVGVEDLGVLVPRLVGVAVLKLCTLVEVIVSRERSIPVVFVCRAVE